MQRRKDLISKNISRRDEMENKRPTAIDLFAGCGGLSKGFEEAGFEIAAANEFWKPAYETYARNHPNTKLFTGDITDEKTRREIIGFFRDRKCDVLIGGPPCQAYSMAGLRDPDDPRGKLFEDYIYIVGSIKPKVLVMENVKGILTMMHDRDDLTEEEGKKLSSLKQLEKERARLMLKRKQSKNTPRVKFTPEEDERLRKVKLEIRRDRKLVDSLRERVTDMIVRRLSEIGYKVKFRLLNAADYGVPQKRERVIFIGTRYGVPIIFPEPTHGKNPMMTLSGRRLKPWVTVRDAIDDLKDKEEDAELGHVLTHHGKEFSTKIRSTPVGKGVFVGYSDAFFRNPPDVPSRTVKENHGGTLVHYEKNRVMTPRELARLQSFPDDYVFSGTKSTVLKQIGDAVPPKLGEAIGKAVRKMLKEIEKLNVP
jgi:DNA (cytosine-5)-methyltransferase 1